MKRDIQVLRDYARRLREVASKEVQDDRRELWRKHNNLHGNSTPIHVRWFVGWDEIIPEACLECENQVYRGCESLLRAQLFQDTIGDDTVIEPWITVRAKFAMSQSWGVESEIIESNEKRGAYKLYSPIKDESDLDKLVKPVHLIDEIATAENFDMIQDAIGDIFDVIVDRSPSQKDICATLGELRGIEEIMWDMIDRPEWLHKLVSFLSEGIISLHEQAERKGDWHLFNNNNQAVPYSIELPDPKADTGAVPTSDLWCFFDAQELTLVSPEMFDEFMLRYQIPIISKFGLCAYGCCEDITRKIHVIKKIPNLRRISVTPWSDIESCAQQIQQDYVVSWRPNPAEMICLGLDTDKVKKIVGETMKIFHQNNCHVDITLKDIKTVQGKPENLMNWVKAVREVLIC